jgi:hypothetical protein
MDLVGHGSNQDFAVAMDRVADRIGHLGCSPEVEPLAATSLAPSRRGFGSIEEAVSIVLGSAGQMRTRDVHAAVEGLLEEPVSRSSVKNSLARKSVGHARRFERVGRGRYRLAH